MGLNFERTNFWYILMLKCSSKQEPIFSNRDQLVGHWLDSSWPQQQILSHNITFDQTNNIQHNLIYEPHTHCYVPPVSKHPFHNWIKNKKILLDNAILLFQWNNGQYKAKAETTSREWNVFVPHTVMAMESLYRHKTEQVNIYTGF